MELSRKRKKQLKRLRGTASDVWNDQKDVLDHASQVVREASKQMAHLGREEVAPRLRDAVDNHVRPGIATGIAATRSAAGSTREKLMEDVLPAVSSALASAIAVLEASRNPQVREAIGRVSKVGSRLGSKVVPTTKSAGPGRYILIGVGLVAAAGIAYAAWQTLRADDELWVSDEFDDGEPEGNAK